MLTIAGIQTLASRRERAENSVLTLYLNLDQSEQANLNRGFEAELKDLLASVRENITNDDELRRFDDASQRVRNFVAEYPTAKRGLVVIVDPAEGFFWSEETDLPVENRIRWGREVFIQPLAEAFDEYEPVGIVLLDRANLRLFKMSLGRIEEHIGERFPGRVRHIKTVGTDHLASASRVQRKADERVRANLKHGVKDLDRLAEKYGFQRIILAGSSEITAEFRNLLPKRLAARIIGTVDIAMGATAEEVRTITAPIAEKFERETEEALVSDLVTSAAKSDHVVVGLGHALHALNQGRVWQLVYASGFHAPGYECQQCAALFSIEADCCPSCDSAVYPIEDVVEQAVDHAVRKGLKVEVIRGDEAESSLTNAGGIGAYLKTRTARRRAS